MLAGLAIPVVFIAASLAVDTTNSMSMKARLQNAVDSAALATVTRLSQDDDLSVEDAKAFAATFLQGQVEEDIPVFANMSVQPVITITPIDDEGRTIWRVAIAMSGTQTLTPMARVMGRESLTVNVVGKSEGGSSAALGSFSMALVLDKSGSMDWDLESGSSVEGVNVVLGPDGQPLGSLNKMDVLKIAVSAMVTQFQASDPDRKYVRLGASSYDIKLRETQNLVWNLGKVTDFVNTLDADGGTDSTDAFKWGYQRLMKDKEVTKHAERSGQVPDKFLVFMTDGDNNYNSADTSTKILCDGAKADGIQVYTVAFAAPWRGKQLLSYCASSPEHFFDAGNSSELIAAFKSIGIQASKIAARLTE